MTGLLRNVAIFWGGLHSVTEPVAGVFSRPVALMVGLQ